MTLHMDQRGIWPADDVLLWSLELCQVSEDEGYGLLLVAQDEKQSIFERVGLFKVRSQTRHESACLWREITIV